jgi:hypothetical protein
MNDYIYQSVDPAYNRISLATLIIVVVNMPGHYMPPLASEIDW